MQSCVSAHQPLNTRGISIVVYPLYQLAAISFRNLPFTSLFLILFSLEGPHSSGGICTFFHPRVPTEQGTRVHLGRATHPTAGCSTTNSNCFVSFPLSSSHFLLQQYTVFKTPSCQACFHCPLARPEEDLPVYGQMLLAALWTGQGHDLSSQDKSLKLCQCPCHFQGMCFLGIQI